MHPTLQEYLHSYPTEHFFMSQRGERLKILVDKAGDWACVLAAGLSPEQDANVNPNLFYPLDKSATTEWTSRVTSGERLHDLRVFPAHEAFDFAMQRMLYYERDLDSEEIAGCCRQSIRKFFSGRAYNDLSDAEKLDYCGIEIVYDLLAREEFEAALQSWGHLATVVRDAFLPRTVAWMRSKGQPDSAMLTS